MKEKKFVKTENGFYTGTYNINSFNPFDAVIAFIIAIVAMELMGLAFNAVLDSYESTYGSYSYYFVSVLSTLLSQFVIFLIAFVFCKVRHVNFLSGGGFTFRFDWVNILFASLLIIGVDLLLSTVHTQFGDDLLRAVYSTNMEQYENSLPQTVEGLDILWALLLMYILTPLLPCIIEEGLFRGVVLRGLSQFGKLFAIIVSAMMFSFMHGNPMQILLQFIFGLLVGSVVMLTRNFAVGCVMHFISNYMVVRLAVLTEMTDAAVRNGRYLYDAISIVIGTIFLIVSIIYFIKLFLSQYKREILKKPEKQTYSDLVKFSFVDSGEVDENGEKVYKKIYWNEIAVGDFSLAEKSFSYNGRNYVANKPTKKVVFTKVLIVLSLIVSAVLIFVL